MDFNFSDNKGKNKRLAEDTSPTALDVPQENPSPRILRRHHHRRRNVAASHWGPDPLAAPSLSLLTGPFNVYKALLRHPNLFFQFALRLPYPLIISLYAIDKEFHYRLNKYSVGLIHDYAKYHAPLASYIFSWVLYPDLCISDPMLRPMDHRTWLARDVPGFRWLGMVLWRERVVRGILTRLALETHRVPRACEASLMKFWVLMETSTTKLRRAFLADRSVWADADVLLFQLFLLKLDMRFAEPVLGNGVAGLGHLLLSQKGLDTLWGVLRGRVKLDYDGVTDMLVRTYAMEDLDTATHPWLDDEADNGIPEEEWGILSRESWHMDGAKMDSPVDMVIAEGIRRGLHVQQYYMDFVLYGHTDPAMGANLPVPRHWRQDKGIVVPKEGWPGQSTRTGMLRMLDQRFGVRGNADGHVMDTSV